MINKKITFNGWSPRIKAINIKSFNPDDTGIFISQTDSFKVKFTIDDRDSNTSKIDIIKGTTTIGSAKIIKFLGTDSITLPPIKNPGDTTLLVRVFDKMGYTDDSIVKINVREFPPAAFIKDTIRVAFDDSYNFTVELFNCTGFDWKLYNANETIKDSGTAKLSNLKIGRFDSIGMYTLKVTPLNENNKIDTNKVGKTKTCVIIAKKYNCQTFFVGHDSTITVKVNRPYPLSVAVKKDGTIINNTGVRYSWANISDSWITLGDSDTVLNFKDSIQPFSMSVNGIVNGDTAWEARLLVNVRLYRPLFNFVDTTSYQVSTDSIVRLKYKANPNFEDSTPVSSIYYRIPTLGDSAIKYDSASGIRINTIGNYIIEMWCVDKDSIKSLPDTAIIEIYSNFPVISLKSETIAVALNEPVSISGIQTKTGRDGKAIDSILYDIDNNGSYDGAVKVGANNTSEITLKPYTELTSTSITIACKDIAGKFSSLVKLYINVFLNVPKVDSCQLLVTSTKYKSKPVDFKISITDPDDKLLLVKVFANGVLFDSLGSVGNQDTISLKFNASGTYRIQFIAFDLKMHPSDTFSLADLLVVDEGRPVIKNLSIKNPHQIFVNDTVQCRVSGVDYNGSIKEYYYYFNDTLSLPVQIKPDSSAFKTAFTSSGMYKLFVKVMDNDSLFSAMMMDSIVVKKGEPVVNTINVDSSFCYVNSKRTFTITSSDTNGTIRKMEISWNGDTLGDTSITYTDSLNNRSETVKHTFDTTEIGNRIINVRAEDDDGLKSAWKACSVSVRKGIPKILSAIPGLDVNNLFIKDTVNFTVTVSDSNANADSVYFLINTMKNGYKVDSNNMCKIGYKFSKTDTLLDLVKFIVIDKTKFSDSTSLHVHVSPGRPKVDSVKVVTVTGSDFFVKDNNTIKIYVSDNNGTPKKILVAWNNNESAPTESLTINGTSGEFTHWYDTSMSGARTVRFWVDDNDTLRSAVYNTNILVRKGAPSIWGDKGDTVWVVVKNGPGNYYYNANYYDTNGTIDTFYFSTSNNLPSATAFYRVDSAMITISEDLCNSYLGARYIWVKDDDGLISGGKFFVSADSAPPEPTLGNVTIQGDSVKLAWENSDLKDGDLTLFQIQCDTNSSPVTIVKAFGTCRKSGTEFYYWYHPPLSGKFRWKITAKDARGSSSVSVGTPYFDFVKP
jgi:hypothetical protein